MLDLKNIRNLGSLEFLAKQAVEGFITGLHKSPFHGFSVEFAEHKPYNTGDSTRNIDWKVFARTDKLYTKRYEEETNLRCHILLDNSSSMYYPEKNAGKITFSTYAIAALIHLLRKQRDAVALHVFSETIELATPVRSTGSHAHNLMVMLEGLLNKKPDGAKKTATSKIIHQIANTIHRRSLVIIFSDMFENSENQEDLLNALQHLKHNKHEVVVFHTIDKKSELDFEFENRPYLFTDAETGEKVKLYPEQIKEKYTEDMKAFINDLKIKCGQYKIDFVEADINESLDMVLYTYLMKRSRMAR